MNKRTTNTANEKALGQSFEGSGSHTTDTHNSTGIKPAQIELKLETKTDQPATKTRKYSLKSTATEAQYDRIDQAYDHVGKLISTLDFRKMGVLHPAGRIKEMNEKLGYYIPMVDQRTVIDEQGFPHPRIAFYELVDRPVQGRRA